MLDVIDERIQRKRVRFRRVHEPPHIRPMVGLEANLTAGPHGARSPSDERWIDQSMLGVDFSFPRIREVDVQA